MKKWLTILGLILSASVALADGENYSPSKRTVLPTAILSQDNSCDTTTEDITPQSAIPGRIPMHFCGTGHVSVKGNRPNPQPPAPEIHSHTIGLLASVSETSTAVYPVCRATGRAADRYIYFLHRIII